MAEESPEVPVLIVGAGVAGLTASLFLSQHGIKSLIVERRSGPSVHPRARSVNARTMELFRHLDIDEAVRQAGATLNISKGILSGSSLKEVIDKRARKEEKKDFPLASLGDSIGPVRGTFVTQDHLEPVLVDAVKKRGGEIRLNTEVLSFSQSPTSITATIKDLQTASTSTVLATYMIAADGAKSPTRTYLSVPTTGTGTLGNLLNVLFEADLEELVKDREFSLCIISNPSVTGLLTAINNTNRWVIHLSYSPSRGESPSHFPPEKCIELVRLAIGIPDLHIEIRSILPWEPSVNVAEKMQEGRVFLAGDAAHQMPPYAGQGANSGIADAHNLAWKLALVLKDLAPPSLLETYNSERQPVGLEAAEASGAGVDAHGLLSTKLDWGNVRGWMRKLPLISGHGYSYFNSPTISPEYIGLLRGWTWRPWTFASLFLTLDGRPGRRVPHVWLEREGEKISTLDLCGRGFVVFAGSNGGFWEDVGKGAAKKLGVEIVVYCRRAGGDSIMKAEGLETALGISSTGAVLVRPDDFVSWRVRRKPFDPVFEFEKAMKRALCL